MKTITFDKDSAMFVASAFGKKIDSEGYLIEADTGERVVTREGQEVKAKKFGGVIKGSELYINNDIASLIKLSDTLKQRKG